MPTNKPGYMTQYRAVLGPDGLLSFQSKFCAAITRVNRPPSIAILSCPRASGKSWLAGRLLARGLTEGDSLHAPNSENLLVASSASQAQIVLEFARQAAADVPDLRWSNVGCINTKTRARVKILSSDSRRSLGRGAAARLIVADEPSAWAPTSGRRLWDGLVTSLGKGERRTTLVAIGTIAPAPPSSWWPSLVAEGSDVDAGILVQTIQANPEKWRDFDECLRVNPATAVNPHLEQVLRREHVQALKSERAAVSYRQFRLNLSEGESTDSQPLISEGEWARIMARECPPRSGRPVAAVDLGGGRSWSACCCLWPETSRIEVWCQSAGDRPLEAMEREDQQPEGLYTSMAREGGLSISAGRAVPDVGELLERLWPLEPTILLCDSYRADELRAVVAGRVPVKERARGGGETAGNIAALRARLLDFGAGVAPESRGILGHGFKETAMTINANGEVRVQKRSERRSRDDGVAAMLLTCGELARRPAPVELRGAVISPEGLVTWL